MSIDPAARFGPTRHGQWMLRRMVRLARRQRGVCVGGEWHVPCLYCMEWFTLREMTIEHLENRRDGGTNQLNNTVLTCDPCNNGRNAREMVASSHYRMLGKKTRRKIEAWTGARLLYIAPLTGSDSRLRCLSPGLRELERAFQARQEPFKRLSWETLPDDDQRCITVQSR